MDPFDIHGKHITITGASSGFGHHFAGVLAAQGAKVSLGARRTDKLAARVEEISAAGGTATALPLDVRNSESIHAFLESAAAANGPIDTLINNAGVEAGAKTYTMIDEDDWDFVMDTNLKGAWVASKAYTEHVQANGNGGGNIVMVSSITDRRTIKGQRFLAEHRLSGGQYAHGQVFVAVGRCGHIDRIYGVVSDQGAGFIIPAPDAVAPCVVLGLGAVAAHYGTDRRAVRLLQRRAAFHLGHIPAAENAPSHDAC